MSAYSIICTVFRNSFRQRTSRFQALGRPISSTTSRSPASDNEKRKARRGAVAGPRQDMGRPISISQMLSLPVVDLDDELPDGPRVDLVLCHLPHLFRDRRFDQAMVDRLEPGGSLAVAVQSEVGPGPGPFRVRPGDLLDAFGKLEVVVHREADGKAWILAKPPRP